MKNKRNLFVSIISLVLALCLTFSVGFACGGSDDSFEEGDVITYEGTHNFTAEPTDKEFIKNGKTNYMIVTSATETTNESLAKTELMKFWQEATGSSIGGTKDNDMTHSADQKYISIGDTSLLQSSGIVTLLEGQSSYDVLYETLGYDGVRIVTVDNNIYLVGGSDYGTVYAVYDFLEILFNFDIYYIDCYDIDTNVKNINLYDFNVTDIPDIAYRGGGVGYQRLWQHYLISDMELQKTGWRMRTPYSYWQAQQGTPCYEKNSDGVYVLSTSSTAGVHNDMDVINPAVYKGDHPSWFSSGGDICFTCGNAINDEASGETKDEAVAREFEALCQEIAKRMFQTILWQNGEYKGTPMRQYLLFTMEDATAACNCSYCAANTKKYGAYSSNIILAANRVEEILYNEILKTEREKCEADENYYTDANDYMYTYKNGEKIEWSKSNSLYRYEDYYRDDFSLQFFAYAYASDAPAEQDSNGDWVPKDEKMVLHDHITPWVAISAEAQNDFYSDANAKWRARLYGWDALSQDGYMHWGYATSFANGALPYNTFQVYTAEHYKLLAKTNCVMSFEETLFGGNYGGITAFCQLFVYLDSKLMWNCNLDFNELVTKYFKAMYQDAWQIMYNLYVSEKDWGAYTWNANDAMSTGSNSVKEDYWSYFVAKDWVNYVDEALLAIDYMKDSDPDLYEKTKNHINVEWMCPAFILLQFYRNDMPQAECDAMKLKMKEVIADADITVVGQGNATYESFLNGLS